MKLNGRSSATSPIVAVLLMICIAVVSGLIVHDFVRSIAFSISATNSEVGGARIVAKAATIERSNSCYIALYLGNVGGAAAKIKGAYVRAAGGEKRFYGLDRISFSTGKNEVEPSKTVCMKTWVEEGFIKSDTVYNVRVVTAGGASAIINLRA